MGSAVQPFSYELPKERIAQRPIQPPEAAKMLVIDRANGTLTDTTFKDLPELLTPADLLVFNDTRVIPARLFGKLPSGADVEVLLVQQLDGDHQWLCIGRPLKKIRQSLSVDFGQGLTGVVTDSNGPDRVTLSFESTTTATVPELLERIGTMPIPPYIRDGRADDDDKIDYQTIFAKNRGSVAAPTASLHFSPTLMDSIEQRGVRKSFVTLHVGTASFLPITVDGQLRPPGAETLRVEPQVLSDVETVKARGGRAIAVGTTAVRALESAARDLLSGATELFIEPGHTFLAVDALVTNFHQPGTTHLLLVEALLGRALLEASYFHALERGYRFLSYGDGMIIL